jgi:calcineurin-like phosphoesterase family protein
MSPRNLICEALALHGHVHGSLEPEPRDMDVGVDTWGGAPVSLGEVRRIVCPFDSKVQGKHMLVQRYWRG